MPSMIQKEIDDARITTPSDTSVGRVETPGFSDGTINSSKRSRPSLLASVGKIFSRSKRRSSKERNSPSLTPLESKYLSLVNSSADRIVFAVLEACHLPKDQIDTLIRKGRLHSIRKIVTMTEDDWTMLMTLDDDLSLVDFKTILQFQLWYSEEDNTDLRENQDLLCEALKNGVLDDYMRELSKVQTPPDASMDVSPKNAPPDLNDLEGMPELEDIIDDVGPQIVDRF